MYRIYDSTCPTGKPCASFDNLLYALNYAQFEHNFAGHIIKVVLFAGNDLVRVIKVFGSVEA